MSPAMDVSKLFDEAWFSDITIKAGTEEVKCHRNILSLASPYFERLFSPVSGFADKDKEVVELYDDNADAVVAMLRYIYTNNYHIAVATEPTPQDHLNVYSVAHKYLLEDLERASLAHFRELLAKRTAFCENTGDAAGIYESMQLLLDYKDHIENATTWAEKLCAENITILMGLEDFRSALGRNDFGLLGLATSALEKAMGRHIIWACTHCKGHWLDRGLSSPSCSVATSAGHCLFTIDFKLRL